MLRALHYRLTKNSLYRVTSRRLIRRLRQGLGTPEPWGALIALLARYPESVYLDIGAHNGDTIQRVRDECRNPIHGFEPTPKIYQDLLKRFQNYPNITLWNSACSDTDGQATFFLNNNSQTNSLFDNAIGNSSYFQSATAHKGQTKVSTLRIDTWVKEHLSPPNIPLIIKCDVQGAEQLLISGARETLNSRCLAFYSEVQLAEMYADQSSYCEINDLLTKQLGFVIKDIYPCLHDTSGRAVQFDVLWIKPSVLA